jgi:dihydrodipicolinate synthase/N-acetylneuraminate lyase
VRTDSVLSPDVAQRNPEIFMMEQVRGIVLPSPTVFLEDGRVDEKLMRELTDWFIDCGVHAFFVLGSYGQGPAMTPDERKKVAQIVVQQVKHRVPVVVHIGAVDPFTAIDLGKHAKSIGADAIGHVGPYYYADRSEYEIIEHFKMVDRALGMPILVYNNPRYSGYNIHQAFMARVSGDGAEYLRRQAGDGQCRRSDGVYENG